VAGEIIVKLDAIASTASSRAVFAKANGLHETGVVEGTNWYTFGIDDAVAAPTKITVLESKPGVAAAVPNYELEWSSFPQDPPNDPSWDDQWGASKIKLLTAWQRAGGGNGSHMIAIVGSGVQGGIDANGAWTTQHPDLGYVDGRNFTLPYVNGQPQRKKFNDDCGHGTIVAGVAAAFANNGKGIAGVAYNAPIWALRVNGDGCSNPTVAAAAKAITWAANNGAYAITASWGKNIPADADAQPLKDAVDYAYAHGVPVVTSSGNGNQSHFEDYVPARWATAITTGGTNSSDKRCTWTQDLDSLGANYGSPGLDVSAPCLDVVTTTLGSGYGTYSGTSLSVPYVAGVVFLMKSRYPSWTSSQIKNRLWSSADKVGGYSYAWNSFCGGQSKELGCGRLDAAGAVQ
jgi:thermitase